MASEAWNVNFFLAAQKSCTRRGLKFLSEQLQAYQKAVGDAQARYENMRRVEQMQHKSSSSAYDKFCESTRKAKELLWRGVSENAGYALELQFRLHADESVLSLPIGKALEIMMLGKIKSELNHE